MIQIQQQIDSVIMGLKQRGALSEVRFVREYSTEKIETPVRGMLAVVGITQITRENGFFGGRLSSSVSGERYSVKAEIRVYAPASENGTGLSCVVSELLAILEDADSGHIITGVSASPIEFDPNTNAVFRKVEFNAAFCLSGEDQSGF